MLCALLFAGGALAGDVDFPGPAPGEPQTQVAAGLFTFTNQVLAAGWRTNAGALRPEFFHNRLATQYWSQAGSECFRLDYDPQGSARYVAVQLSAAVVQALASRDGTNWLTLATFNRSEFAGPPAFVAVGKMGPMQPEADAASSGPPGECRIGDFRVKGSAGQTLLADSFDTLGPDWTLSVSSKPGTALVASNGMAVVRAASFVHAFARQPAPAMTALASCRVEKGTDVGSNWAPGLSLTWASGSRVTVSYAAVPNWFLVTTHQGALAAELPSLSAPRVLAASQFQIVRGPEFRTVLPVASSLRAADRRPGMELAAQLRHPAYGVEVDWRIILREGANYLRQVLTLQSSAAAGEISSVEALDLALTSSPTVHGMVPGCPGTAGQAFFGAESPLSWPVFGAGRIAFPVAVRIPFLPDATWDYSSVIGVYPPGQLRRSFLYYIELERARPYRQMLNWNPWFDMDVLIDEAGMAEAIDACDRELRQRHGVGVEAFAIDDGYDDPARGFWVIDTNKFPHGFTWLRDRARSAGSNLGLWVPPAGGFPYAWYYGFDQVAVRADQGAAAGILAGSYDLSQRVYYQWWLNHWREQVRDNGVVYFKWDHAGNWGYSYPHYLAVFRAATELRAEATNVYINASTATWSSPFWLRHVDSIWRGGVDGGTNGLGDQREQWLSYRDGETYANVVRGTPLHPLNSLMLHGIQHGLRGYGEVVSRAGPDLRHEARTFFGSGTQLQELYVSPSIMSPTSWTHLAEAILWARGNADVLVDTHWVGGDPAARQVYGWGAWNARKATLILRNPADWTNSITIDLATAFELPAGAPTLYDLTTPYADARVPEAWMQAGRPATFSLSSFEVIVLDAVPRLPYPERVRAWDPLGYWRLGDSGSVAVDQGGRYPGTYLNTMNPVIPGALLEGDDGAVRMDGTQSYVRVSEAAVFDFTGTNAFTLSAWVQFDAVPAPGRMARLISKGQAGGGGYGLGLAGDRELRFDAGGAGVAIATIAPVVTGRWDHVAAVRRGVSLELYWNGASAGTNTIAALTASSSALQFGGNPAGAPDESFRGLLDEVAVFDRPLTGGEIKVLCVSQSGLRVPPKIVQPLESLVRDLSAVAAFTISATGAEPLSYQWFFDGTAIPGATAATFVIPAVSYRDAGLYSVWVSNALGSTQSAPAQLTVRSTGAYPGAVLADRPAAYWRLNETNGPNALDTWSSHDGALMGRVLLSRPGAMPNDADTAAGFNALTPGYVEVPFAPELNAPAFTVECWARVTGGQGTYRSVVSSRSVSPLGGYMLYAGGDNRWQFFTGPAAGDLSAWQVTWGPPIADGQWTHLAATFDGALQTFYVDGALVARQALRVTPNGSRPLRLGAGATEGAGDFYFTGEVDEVAVYDRALTPARIQAHFAAAQQPLRVSLERVGTRLLLTWPSGRLQQASGLDGPWELVEGATSPWTISAPASVPCFYRVQVR